MTPEQSLKLLDYYASEALLKRKPREEANEAALTIAKVIAEYNRFNKPQPKVNVQQENYPNTDRAEQIRAANILAGKRMGISETVSPTFEEVGSDINEGGMQ